LLCGVLLLLVEPPAAGADSDGLCLDCHESELEQPFNTSWHVLHSTTGSGSAVGCTGCHGASESHLEGEAPTVVFGRDSTTAIEDQNAVCLGCHDDAARSWWPGSSHHDEDLACTNCHNIHSNENLIADRAQQSELCYGCHTGVRSAAALRSHHPINEGRTACVDCHQPHGSSNEAMLTEPSLNDTCYSCHAEKRGPFLFEHQPVTEDCSTCHDPHGTINDALLTARAPFLCQQCHSTAFHPSQLNSGSGLPGAGGSQTMLGRNCMNCHAQVHGSNHPSGARMSR
jgi:DmsE family decaheme c-type cytochrome